MRRGVGLAVRDRRGGSGTADIPVPGYDQPFRARLGGTDVLTLGHVIGEECYAFPLPLPTSPRWIIDAGANTGYAAVYLASRYPEATVIAVEPDAGNYELLAHHAERHANIVPVQAALWTHDGTVDLADAGRGDWGFAVADAIVDVEAASAVEVEAITVGSLMERHEMDRIHLFKLDIEGGERAIFRDADAWIDAVDAIVLELHDRMLPGCTEAFEAATRSFPTSVQRGDDTFVARSAPEAAGAPGSARRPEGGRSS